MRLGVEVSSRPGPASRWTALAARVPLWPALAAVSAAVLVAQAPRPHATAWHYFHGAALLLIGHGPAGDASGLHLYGAHPEFQFGPVSVVAAIPFAVLGTSLGS